MGSPVTSHVLDTARGRPAAGVPAMLEMKGPAGDWITLARGITNDDGRITDWLPDDHRLKPGFYRVLFDTTTYFRITDQSGFFPYVHIAFEVENPKQHYHIPLLLSPYGYSTYRGS